MPLSIQSILNRRARAPAGFDGGGAYMGRVGAETIVLAPTAGNVTDIITDFGDTGGIGDDLIDVSAYSFASVAGIARAQAQTT